MKNYNKTIGALVAVSAIATGRAAAIEINYELSAEYANEYIFRSLNLGQDPVAAGLVANTEIDKFGVTASAVYKAWTRTAGGAAPQGNMVDELELSTEVTYDFDHFTFGVGYIHYFFPANNAGSIPDFAELPISIYKTFGLIDIGLTHFYGVNSGVDFDGYTELNFSNTTEITEGLDLSTGLAVGYLVEQDALSHITLSAALNYSLTETATVSPFIAHNWSLTERGINAGTKNEIFGGVRLTVNF